MVEGNESVLQVRLSTAIAFLEESGRRDYRRLHLRAAESLAFVHRHFTIASPLKSTQLVIFLCNESNLFNQIIKAFSVQYLWWDVIGMATFHNFHRLFAAHKWANRTRWKPQMRWMSETWFLPKYSEWTTRASTTNVPYLYHFPHRTLLIPPVAFTRFSHFLRVSFFFRFSNWSHSSLYGERAYIE